MHTTSATYGTEQERVIFGEKSDHLGNVRAVVSDIRQPVDSDNDGVIDSYQADIRAYYDYYPMGGMLMSGRTYNAPDHRWKYQGQESDDEIYGTGNLYAYRFRMSDPRIGGQFWSIDPLFRQYPGWSPYAFSQRRPIDGIELEGLEWQPVDADGNDVAIDADNIADYVWVGYEPDYDNWDGIPNELPLVAPEGTVSEAYRRIGDWSAIFYTSDIETNTGSTNFRIITDQATRDEIDELHPDIQESTKELLLRSMFENNQELRITSAFRGATEQNNLYAQGRSQATVNNATDAWGEPLTDITAQPNSPWRTNATWGKSYHNYGLAIDVVGYNSNTGAINYRINWNSVHGLAQRLGFGLGPAGDNPHMQMNFGRHWRTLRNMETDENGFIIFP